MSVFGLLVVFLPTLIGISIDLMHPNNLLFINESHTSINASNSVSVQRSSD